MLNFSWTEIIWSSPLENTDTFPTMKSQLLRGKAKELNGHHSHTTERPGRPVLCGHAPTAASATSEASTRSDLVRTWNSREKTIFVSFFSTITSTTRAPLNLLRSLLRLHPPLFQGFITNPQDWTKVTCIANTEFISFPLRVQWMNAKLILR